ncbi:MAG: type I restriction-modification system subunit M N-terminal domain-containing protein [Methylococcales bacterium]|nr:type I restriction-modification system subunit M N-terminal domain-containing protein [Methylococcales bacterium]
MRANSKLTAAEYKDLVLGLILLRYAQNRYEQAKAAIEAAMPETPRGKLKPAKEHFLASGAMLVPEQSQYDYLANLPEGVGICEALNTAMRLIEEEYAGLAVILPKNYPGQLLTFTAIMNAYRGDPQAISDVAKQLQAQAIEQAINLAEAINALRKQYADSIANNPALDFSEAQVELAQRLSIADDADYTACHALLSRFENPAATLTGLLEGCKTQLDAAKKALDKKDSAGKKQLDEQRKLLRELNGAINAYQNQYTKSQIGEPLQDNLVMKYWTEYMDELKQRIGKAEDQQEELKLKHHLKRVEETEVCIVVSSEQNEIQKLAKLGLDIEKHREKMVERNLETEFKDENNPFRLAIVCAMWITGFDVPPVSTVYLDKPIKGHTLVQTIARANRVYDDEKENSLIVDYGNVYKNLQEAYSVYRTMCFTSFTAFYEPAKRG